MDLFLQIVPILALAVLCAGWVGVQLLARRLGTKNHFEHGSSSCGQCGCGDSCVRKSAEKQ